MATSRPPAITCVNPACERPFAAAVAFCPFCSRAQPATAKADPVAQETVAHNDALPPPVPSLPPIPPSPAAVAEQGAAAAAAAGKKKKQKVVQPPVAGDAAAVVPDPRPAPVAPPRRSGSRLPVVLVALVVGSVAAALFLRDDGKKEATDGTQFEQWRTTVEACLQKEDPACADATLADLRRSAPTAYWSDLQQRTQHLRQQLENQAQQAAELQRQQREAAERAAVEEAEKAAAERQRAEAEDAAELAVPTQGYSRPAIPDRPASLLPGAQQDPPVRYPSQALRDGAGGSVILTINVGADGTARHVSVFRSSGNRYLDRAAEEAASRWRYMPAIISGQAAAGVIQKEITFDPPSSSSRGDASMPQSGQEVSMIDKARRELRAGRYDVAIALAESALSINPSSRDARDVIQQARSERARLMRETTIE